MYLQEGHAVGNHSWDHPKGWETDTGKYIENVKKCGEVVKSIMFRPPYGKMSRSQQKALRKEFNIIMWTVLSRDYDQKIDAGTCLEKTWKYTRPGAIVLFHDSSKTIEKLEYVLPKYLELASGAGYKFKAMGGGR
jgi:peptidoglycan/xylan/chitin deacetylase (PgdA/CDA1 family)